MQARKTADSRRTAADRIVMLWRHGAPEATEALAAVSSHVTKRMSPSGAVRAFHAMVTFISPAHQVTEVL